MRQYDQNKKEILNAAYFRQIPEVKRSSLSLTFFKDYLKTMKEICKDSKNEFK